MSKSELIDAIREHNRTVSPEFLDRFTETDLKAYLDRVCLIGGRVSGPPGMNPTLARDRELVIA